MADYHDPTDPAHMTPEDRLAEVADILATGVLRLRSRSALAGQAAPFPGPETSVESEQTGLDDCGKTSPHGPRG